MNQAIMYSRTMQIVGRIASKHRGVRWMSVRPEMVTSNQLIRQKITLNHLERLKKRGTPITMLTAYDYPTGRICEAHDVDIALVGDSLAQVCLGYDSTTRLTMDEMLHHVKAVVRGCKTPFLVADMPFGSYHGAINDTVRNAIRLIQEGGAESVKMEGGEELVPVIQQLTRVGIPVMAHIGLMPQRAASSSGYKVQGKTAAAAHSLMRAAYALQDAGAYSIVLEAVPASVGAYITSKVDIPTIGIGAGAHTDGQVLVTPDALGTWEGHKAKFVRRFADVKSATQEGVDGYIEAVRARTFPDNSESYSIAEEEWQRFLGLEGVRPEIAIHSMPSPARRVATN